MTAALRASELFASRFGEPPVSSEPIAGQGSRRRMSRLRGTNGARAVAVFGPDAKENRAFIAFSRALRKIGLPVPEVVGVDEGAGVYLVEDLGDTTLFTALEAGRRVGGEAFPADVAPLYRRTLDLLPRFQLEGAQVIDFALAHPRAEFDRQAMAWDLQSFKYCFLRLSHLSFDEAALEDDFERLMAFLLEVPRDAFCYRDFQSRNVMVRDGEPWFIDYQGGRRGALHYDVASMLYDGKAALSDAVRAELLDHYLGALETHTDVDREAFHRHFAGFVILRILQAMGAYGYLGLYQGMPHFKRSIPPAARNLRGLLERDAVPVDVPELSKVFERIAVAYADVPDAAAAKGLVVRIGSFSYKRGVPEDPGGHGGGFVFDCRALPNPGRLDTYKTRTGRDPDVVAWLEALDTTEAFFTRALTLVDTQLQAYAGRGFDSLQVLFGCTGGQHRSVYLAERLAKAARGAFPDATIEMTHHAAPHWPRPADA